MCSWTRTHANWLLFVVKIESWQTPRRIFCNWHVTNFHTTNALLLENMHFGDLCPRWLIDRDTNRGFRLAVHSLRQLLSHIQLLSAAKALFSNAKAHYVDEPSIDVVLTLDHAFGKLVKLLQSTILCCTQFIIIACINKVRTLSDHHLAHFVNEKLLLTRKQSHQRGHRYSLSLYKFG